MHEVSRTLRIELLAVLIAIVLQGGWLAALLFGRIDVV
jgi:hypothetical protein